MNFFGYAKPSQAQSCSSQKSALLNTPLASATTYNAYFAKINLATTRLMLQFWSGRRLFSLYSQKPHLQQLSQVHKADLTQLEFSPIASWSCFQFLDLSVSRVHEIRQRLKSKKKSNSSKRSYSSYPFDVIIHGGSKSNQSTTSSCASYIITHRDITVLATPEGANTNTKHLTVRLSIHGSLQERWGKMAYKAMQ